MGLNAILADQATLGTARRALAKEACSAAATDAVDSAIKALPKAASDCLSLSKEAGSQLAAKPISLDIPNFGRVNDHLYRSQLPSDAQLAAAAAAGIKTDICLLNPAIPKEAPMIAHEKEMAEGLGMRFVNIPVPYDVDLPPELSAKFISTVENPEMQPALAHCIHGRDRTGEIVADYRVKHDHFTGQRALDEMKQYTFDPARYPYLADYVQRIGAINPPKP